MLAGAACTPSQGALRSLGSTGTTAAARRCPPPAPRPQASVRAAIQGLKLYFVDACHDGALDQAVAKPAPDEQARTARTMHSASAPSARPPAC